MTLNEKLKNYINYYRNNCNYQELSNILNEIKINPRLLISDLKNNLAILTSLLCHQEAIHDINEVCNIKNMILDIFIVIVDFSDFAWDLIDHIGLIGILIDEFHNENNNSLKLKVLKCFQLYLIFNEFENKTIHPCRQICCNFGLKHILNHEKIFGFCRSIVKSIMDFIGAIQSQIVIESYLLTLSLVVRQFPVKLSPELCGDIESYKQFIKFLALVCEGDSYSDASVIGALSCFFHASDLGSGKCFTVANAEFSVSLIYRALSRPENDNVLPSWVFAVLLLIDLLHNQTIVQFIRQQWQPAQYKSICKLLTYEFSSHHCDIILNLFATIKSIIPEWGSAIEKYCTSDSKFMEFIVGLCNRQSDRYAILSWRLLLLYFQPAEIQLQRPLPDYCVSIINSVKFNLEIAFRQDEMAVAENPEILLARNRIRSLTRALIALDMLLQMTDSDALAFQIATISVETRLMACFETLIMNLIDGTQDMVSGLKTASSFDIGTLCESSCWFVVGSRLIVSLLFYGISISARYPSLQICKKQLNTILVKPSLVKIIITCLVQSNCSIYVERSIALITVLSQMPDYDLTRLSQFLYDTTNQANQNCQRLTNNTASALIPDVEEDSLKYKSSIRKLVDSLINGDNKQLAQSDISSIFIEEIRSVREHQNTLEAIITQKENYIRDSHNLVNEYRTKMFNNETRFQNIAIKHAMLQNAFEAQAKLIAEKNEQLTQYEKNLEEKETELAMKQLEIETHQKNLKEMEGKYEKEVKKLSKSDLLIEKYNTLMAKNEEELKQKTKEINRLEQVSKLIGGLIGNKISPESIASSLEGL